MKFKGLWKNVIDIIKNRLIIFFSQFSKLMLILGYSAYCLQCAFGKSILFTLQSIFSLWLVQSLELSGLFREYLGTYCKTLFYYSVRLHRGLKWPIKYVSVTNPLGKSRLSGT